MHIATVATVATVALACIIATTTAAPTHPTVELAGAMERSVCPIREYIDHDENRIPSRIKMLECKHEREPNPMCHEQQATQACCVKHHHKYTMQCMTVTDSVLVRYKSSPQLHKYPARVGCSCQMDPVMAFITGQ